METMFGPCVCKCQQYVLRFERRHSHMRIGVDKAVEGKNCSGIDALFY